MANEQKNHDIGRDETDRLQSGAQFSGKPAVPDDVPGKVLISPELNQYKYNGNKQG